jgi:hypothetical protein
MSTLIEIARNECRNLYPAMVVSHDGDCWNVHESQSTDGQSRLLGYGNSELQALADAASKSDIHVKAAGVE